MIHSWHTGEKMDAFLERMRNSGNVGLSCKAAGVNRVTAYRWASQVDYLCP